MDQARTGVFVLGMHRSGTSATTRAINLLGVPTASDEALKPPSPNNPTGFWEVTRLTKFNNRLLADLGGSSLAPPVLEPGWAERPDFERRRQRARRLFGKAHRTEQWVWKDPRNCVLFPFWRAALAVRPVVVMVHRDPSGVARSLGVRQGLSPAMGFATWERYMRSALSAVEGLPVLLVRYSDLTEGPEDWARHVSGFLRAQGLDCDPEPGVGAIAELVHAGARASGARSGEGDGAPAAAPGVGGAGPGDGVREPSEAQRELLARLEALVGPHERFALPELPPETDWVEPVLAERRAADVLRQQMDERFQSLRRRMRDARAAQAEADQRLEQVLHGRRSRVRSALRRLPGHRGSAPEHTERGALPDFLIIGGQKCGTSSLYRYLGLSPNVELSGKKEVHFFDLQFDRGVDWYMSHFPAVAGAGRRRARRCITGEASPYYIFHPLAPERIRETVPEVRLIALLRDPADRAVSHYYHEFGNGFETLPLTAALDGEAERLAGEAERIVAEPGYVSFNHRHFSYQARGAYADQLARWRSMFPEDQLLLVSSDDLLRTPREVLRRVYEFLELPGEPPSHYSTYNARDYPSVSAEVEARLRRHFEPHNARLRELVGQDFGWAAEAPA